MKNKIFLVACWLILFFFVFFFLSIILSIFRFINPEKNLFNNEYLKKEIYFAIKISLITSFISSIFSLIFSLPIAYLLSRYTFPLKNLIEIILFFPMIISPVALGTMFLIFFKTPIGIFIENTFIRFVFEVPGLILAQLIVAFGVSVNLLKVTFDSINIEYEEIARSLGAKKINTFIYILLPLAKKGLLYTFLLAFARAFSEFGASVTLAGATPFKTETLPIAIYLSLSSGNIYLMAIITLISISISFFILFLLKQIKL